jgi:hypothetical protein
VVASTSNVSNLPDNSPRAVVAASMSAWRAATTVVLLVVSVSMLFCSVVFAEDMVEKKAGSSEIAAAISFSVSNVSGASARRVDICVWRDSTLFFNWLTVVPNVEAVSITATTL